MFCILHHFDPPPLTSKMRNNTELKTIKLYPISSGEFLPKCLVTVTGYYGDQMSQPLQLLHPKKTSSLWWFNHMLTSWQKSSPALPLPLWKQQTLCTHQKQWIRNASWAQICDHLSETSDSKANIFHTVIIMVFKDHKSKTFIKSND